MNANKAIPNVIIFVSFIMFLCRFIILENGRGFFSSMAQISRKWSFEMGAPLWTFTPGFLSMLLSVKSLSLFRITHFWKNGLLLTAEEMTSTLIFSMSCMFSLYTFEKLRDQKQTEPLKIGIAVILNVYKELSEICYNIFFKWHTSWWTLHWYCTYLLFCPLPSWCFWQARRGSECEAACSLSQSQVIGSRSYNHPLYCLWLRVLTVARAGRWVN